MNIFELGFARLKFGEKYELGRGGNKIACYQNSAARRIDLVCSYSCNVSHCKQAAFILEEMDKTTLCFWDRKSGGRSDVAYKNKPSAEFL